MGYKRALFNCSYIEDNTTCENIISFLDGNFDSLKRDFFENNEDISLPSFANFVIYEYGYFSSKDVPFADGGNVTYSLYTK